MPNITDWPAKSGKLYTYGINPIGTAFKDEAGNYIYAKVTTAGWVAVYIGETSNLKDRLANHEKEPCAKQNGATHVHAHLHLNGGGEQARRAEESDLIEQHSPVCND